MDPLKNHTVTTRTGTPLPLRPRRRGVCGGLRRRPSNDDHDSTHPDDDCERVGDAEAVTQDHDEDRSKQTTQRKWSEPSDGRRESGDERPDHPPRPTDDRDPNLVKKV